MDSTLDDPLNQSHLEQINANLALIERALVQAEKAKRAGLNMDAQVQKLNAARDQYRQIKAVYFPNAS